VLQNIDPFGKGHCQHRRCVTSLSIQPLLSRQREALGWYVTDADARSPSRRRPGLYNNRNILGNVFRVNISLALPHVQRKALSDLGGGDITR